MKVAELIAKFPPGIQVSHRVYGKGIACGSALQGKDWGPNTELRLMVRVYFGDGTEKMLDSYSLTIHRG